MNAQLILVGFMGSGKSAVGARLAAVLGWKLVDLDRFVERQAGRKIAAIFAVEGEEGFRRREREALREALTQEKVVVSCGGGAVLREENRALLLAHPAVYRLRVSEKMVMERVGRSRHRPLLRVADPAARVRQLMQEREPLYALFPRQVETDGRSVEEIADQILLEWRSSCTACVKDM